MCTSFVDSTHVSSINNDSRTVTKSSVRMFGERNHLKQSTTHVSYYSYRHTKDVPNEEGVNLLQFIQMQS